jgi:uncharacterized damage-inducible protein DinB
MKDAEERRLLDAVLDSWDRSNRALVNLLRLIPTHGLDGRIREGSPTVSQMFSHMHHERMVSVFENAPEYAGPVPAEEWRHEPDANRISEMLDESAKRVRDAVAGRVEANRSLDRDFAHPIQLLHFLMFHEGYHHGQIKSALKSAGCPISDEDAGPLIWDVWRAS